MDEIVEIFHANDLGDTAPLRDLSRRHVAEAKMADQTLSLQLCERGERLIERSFARSVPIPHEPQVDNVQHVDTQVPQVVVDGANKVRTMISVMEKACLMRT
jgi:hypothetical protein